MAYPSLVLLLETIELSVNARLIHPEDGTIYELGGISILGRGAGCGVTIPELNVSRRHAMIREQSDGFWFFDLGSFNGSYLNGSRVTTSRRLEPGDVIQISDVSFRFEQDEAPPGLAVDDAAFEASTISHIRLEETVLLVTDIQGYSRLSELLEPDELARIIGSWYAHTEEIIARHGGTLDKFVGDCALAYWRDDPPDTRLLALSAAGAMQAASAETYAAHREKLDSVGVTFSTGVALHLGQVAHGGMSAREFTVLGDAVNVAFRMEAMTREFDCQIITSAEFLDGWEDGKKHCQPLGSHQVKGRSAPVKLFAVEVPPSPVPHDGSVAGSD